MIAPSFIKPRRPNFERCAIIPVKFGTRGKFSSIVPFLSLVTGLFSVQFWMFYSFTLGKSTGLSNVGKTGHRVLAHGQMLWGETRTRRSDCCFEVCQEHKQGSFLSLSPFLGEGRAESGWSRASVRWPRRSLLMGDPQQGRSHGCWRGSGRRVGGSDGLRMARNS